MRNDDPAQWGWRPVWKPAYALGDVDALGDLVAVVVDGGPCAGLASTVVVCDGDVVRVVREGRIVHEGPAQEIDEHRVLDLVMEGSVA